MAGCGCSSSTGDNWCERSLGRDKQSSKLGCRNHHWLCGSNG